MRHFQNLCILFLLSFSTVSLAQTKSKVMISPKVGIIAQGAPLFRPIYGEAGVIFSRRKLQFPSHSISAIEAGAEFAKAGEDWIIAPKLTYSGTVMLFEARLNAIVFLKGDQVDPRIVPELGINMGIGGIYIGWNAPITNNQINEVGLFRASLTFKIPAY